MTSVCFREDLNEELIYLMFYFIATRDDYLCQQYIHSNSNYSFVNFLD